MENRYVTLTHCDIRKKIHVTFQTFWIIEKSHYSSKLHRTN